MSSRIDIPYTTVNKTERSSDIRSKKEKKKSELIGESENRDRDNILLISDSNSDSILESSGMSDSDTELDENVTSHLTEQTCVVYYIFEVTSDVPTFVGSDEQCYTLKTGDRAVVPTDQAKVLCNRGLAVLIDDVVKFRNNN